jgi:hypothetical protein
MANVLENLFSDIANAIRSKSGENDTMKPIDFPANILELSSGGGGDEGFATVTFMNGNEEI